jgi:hypothetical protein
MANQYTSQLRSGYWKKNKKMTEQEIKESLCYYDKRNPYCTADEEEIKEREHFLESGNFTCNCDNCFYGRTKLAEELLKYFS